MCRCCLRCVDWFSYWFDNLGFFTEGNTYSRCAASSLPLWGNTDIASSRHQKEFLAPLPGRIFNIYQVANHKSHLLAIYIIFHLSLVFLSPTSQKFAVLFALLFCLLFSCRIYSCSCFLVTMVGTTTPPMLPDFEVLYFKQRQGENLKHAWYRLMKSYRVCNLKGDATNLLTNFLRRIGFASQTTFGFCRKREFY